jgi:outer membrane protein TolC
MQKEVEAQGKCVLVSKAAYFPSISFFGSYGAKQAVGSVKIPNEIDGIEDIGQIGISLEIPLFEGGKKRADLQWDKARHALLKEKMRALELQIQLEVESAVFNVFSTKKRILAIEKAVEQAKESLRIEMEKYNLGKGSVTDILDAESALLEIQTSYYISLADYKIYMAQLKFVQGEA